MEKKYYKNLGRIEDEKPKKGSIYQPSGYADGGFFKCAICGERTSWKQLIVPEGHIHGDGTGICSQCFIKD